MRRRIARVLLWLVLATGAAQAEALPALSDAQPGEVLVFGEYEQDNDESNGPEPIEWLVLENTGDSLLLNSVHALECMRYHSSAEPATWESCALRAWLNGEFYEQVFSDAEKDRISLTHLDNPPSERYDIPGGNPTDDHVFILSTQEIQAYFATEADMAATATPCAVAHGVAPYGDNGYVRYWLRNPGMTDNSAAFVQCDFLNYSGTAYAAVREYAVRPAIRLSARALN